MRTPFHPSFPKAFDKPGNVAGERRVAVTGRSSHPREQQESRFSVTPEEVVGTGDTVAVIVRYRGTGKVTGKRLDLAVAHVWDVRGGKVFRFRQFIDTAKFLEVVPDDAATHV